MDNWCCFLRGNYRHGKLVLLSQRKLSSSWKTRVAFSEESQLQESGATSSHRHMINSPTYSIFGQTEDNTVSTVVGSACNAWLVLIQRTGH